MRLEDKFLVLVLPKGSRIKLDGQVYRGNAFNSLISGFLLFLFLGILLLMLFSFVGVGLGRGCLFSLLFRKKHIPKQMYYPK